MFHLMKNITLKNTNYRTFFKKEICEKSTIGKKNTGYISHVSGFHYLITNFLDIEEEVHDVAILNDIFLTLYSKLSCCPASRL